MSERASSVLPVRGRRRCDCGLFVDLWIDRKIKVWDLSAALDPRAPTGTLCVRTLVVSRAATHVGSNRNVAFIMALHFVFSAFFRFY